MRQNYQPVGIGFPLPHRLPRIDWLVPGISFARCQNHSPRISGRSACSEGYKHTGCGLCPYALCA